MRLIALTPCSSAKSINLDPPKYEATTVEGFTLARPVIGGEVRLNARRTGGPVPDAGRILINSSVLTRVFVWFTWFE
jgi:hypothetical protein